jgi:hypothetical protein
MNDAAPDTSTLAPGVRRIKDAPFCWQHKAALKLIRQTFDDRSFLADALAVYLCFTEIASDEQTETFQRTRREIGERSGVSLRQFDRVLAILISIGLVHCRRNTIPGTKELAASTYTLRPVCATPRTAGARLRQARKLAAGTVIEQSSKNVLEKSGTKPGFETNQVDVSKL